MPIIVDEVVISVEVNSPAPAAEKGTSLNGEGESADKQRIIEECVERVLDILARREEP